MANFIANKHTWDYAESTLSFFIYEQAEHNIDVEMNNPAGICWDGSNFYLVDTDDEKVYKYNSAWVFQASFALNVATVNPIGITWDGTFFYVHDTDDSKVHKYNTAFVLQSQHDLHADNDHGVGLCWDGTYFYVADIDDSKVYKYNSAWVFQETIDITDSKGIEWDGTYFYIIGATQKVYKYDSKWNLQSGLYNVSQSIAVLAFGCLAYNGTYFYIIDANNRTVGEFDLDLIAKTIDGHNSAIILYDSMIAYLSPLEQLAGNFEFYFRAIDVTDKVEIQLRDTTGNICIRVKIDTSKIIGDGSDALDPAVNHTWYLGRIDFDCTPNTYDLYIDGVLKLNNQAFGVNDDGNGITYVEISMNTNKNGYMDGVGYDWDGTYTQGDNASDVVDIADDIIECRIIEELYLPSFGNLKFKATSLSEFDAWHIIDFYDSDSVLSWSGIILYPENIAEGNVVIGELTLIGLNSQFNNTYRKNFITARDSDYILKDIIDNALSRYYSHDDEIDNFTITYKYDLKTKIQKMFKYLSMLERAVLHYKPDGEIFFNKYDNLSASGISWSNNTSHVKITSYTPAANRHITRAPVIGAYNNLGQVYVVGKATEDEEIQFGINKLQEWRDPEITNYTEASQLATNLQIIYSLDTQIINMLVAKKKHIQVGYTIEVEWSGIFNIDKKDFLVLRRVWQPMYDITELELTDNILTRDAFNVKVINKIYDEDAQQAYDKPEVQESTEDGTVVPLISISELRTFDAFASALGLILFLHQDVSADIGTYKLLTTTFPDDAKTEVFNATITGDDQEIEQWATPAGGLGVLFFHHGIHNLHFHAYKFSGTKDVRLYFKVYKRAAGGGETLLGTSEESSILAGSETEVEIHVEIHEQAVDATDRLVIKIFAHLEGVGSNPVIYFYVEGTTLTRYNLPLSEVIGGVYSDAEAVAAAALAAHHAGATNEHDGIYYTEAEVTALLHAQAHTLASHSTKAHNELSDAPADAHHVKYTDPNAVDAIEAVGIAAPVSTDWLIFSDAGILKKVAMSTLTPTIMTGLPKYTNVLARGAINNIIGADGKLDATLDCDGWGLSNVIIFALKENSLAYFQHFSAFATDHKFHGDVLSITTNGGSFGVPMYSNTTANRVSVCVDTSINTMPCIGIYVSNNLILTKGTIRDDTWNFTVGKPVYVNGSVFSTVIPPTVGDIVQVVGISLSADSMYFKPSLDWVVRK